MYRKSVRQPLDHYPFQPKSCSVANSLRVRQGTETLHRRSELAACGPGWRQRRLLCTHRALHLDVMVSSPKCSALLVDTSAHTLDLVNSSLPLSSDSPLFPSPLPAPSLFSPSPSLSLSFLLLDLGSQGRTGFPKPNQLLS